MSLRLPAKRCNYPEEGELEGRKRRSQSMSICLTFIRDKLELYLNRHEQKAKSMTNGIKKLP